MFDELPTEAVVARILLGDLHFDLVERVSRLRLLIALDADLGGSDVMLPGGHPSYLACTEARASFVAGYFVATIVLCQALVENLLGAHLKLDESSRPIRGTAPLESGPLRKRPSLREIIAKCVEGGVISAQEARNLERLAEIRNPVTHFRDINDPDHVERRAMDEGIHPMNLFEQDARFAITTIVRLLANPNFAIGRSS